MVCRKCNSDRVYKDGLCDLCYYSRPPKNPPTGKALDILKAKVKRMLRYDTDEGRYMSLEVGKRRREKKKQITDAYTKEEWNAKKESTGGICPRCKRNVGVKKLTKDRIIPLSKVKKGHIYTIDGIQPLCLSCNSTKGTKTTKYI